MQMVYTRTKDEEKIAQVKEIIISDSLGKALILVNSQDAKKIIIDTTGINFDYYTETYMPERILEKITTLRINDKQIKNITDLKEFLRTPRNWASVVYKS